LENHERNATKAKASCWQSSGAEGVLASAERVGLPAKTKSVRIAGMAATAVSIDTLASIDPATGRVLGQIEKTPPETVGKIVARARAAQAEWVRVPIETRCRQLRVLLQCMMKARNELAEAVVRESGKPCVEALFADVFVSLDSAEHWSKEAARALRTTRLPHHSSAAKTKSGYLVHEPLGIIAIISSWNYPLAIPMSQIIPAVVAGNAVVCKTSDFTPRCGQLIEKLFVDAGFSKDLVVVVQGGGEVGQALIDAQPDKVMFTGSVTTGKRVAEACAKNLIPSVLELGGKDAMIVLADANLEVASSGAVWGSYTNCGQVCLSVERLFVEQSVAERFTALCTEKTKKLRLGPGNDRSTDVGPLIRPQHVQRMSDLIHDAVSRGARVMCGGAARPDLGPNFFEPTVITNVDATMKLFQEETFGPILAVQIVRDAEEAVARANDSPFSLAASVWTSNKHHGQAIARRLRAGAVMVNDAISYFGIAEAPHGGCGASGWGRTHGNAGLLEMVQTKYVVRDLLPRHEKPWWYRYGAGLESAADAFLQFEFSRGIGAKLRHGREALKTFFRHHGL
jgi:acyl-CoA reductase-like NAD-dependent aldehyde dehydrogenase